MVDLLRLAVHVRRHGIGIIHVGDRPRDMTAAVVLSRLTGATSVVHVHQCYSEYWTGLARRSITHADVLVPVSNFVGETLVEAGLPPAAVHPIHNAVDPRRWQPDTDRGRARTELGLPADAPIVLTVCRLFPEKGVGELIESMAIARARIPDARLLVVGTPVADDDTYLDDLRRRRDELGLGDSVEFLGWRDDIERLMVAADVFAMPSRGEPFGLVYVEAMAMLRPVVALADGGALEIVADGETGLLSEPGDVERFADHLVELLEDPARASEMGRRGRELMCASFTTERQAAQVEALYSLIAS